VKVGDLVMASEAYSTIGNYGRTKGLVTNIFQPSPANWIHRVEVMLTSTGGRCVFRVEELELISESR